MVFEPAKIRSDSELLPAACAAVGNADAAFQVQAEMLQGGYNIDKQCATSLINACSQALLHTSDQHRRQRLVLLERAGQSISLFFPFSAQCQCIEGHYSWLCGGRKIIPERGPIYPTSLSRCALAIYCVGSSEPYGCAP